MKRYYWKLIDLKNNKIIKNHNRINKNTNKNKNMNITRNFNIKIIEIFTKEFFRLILNKK